MSKTYAEDRFFLLEYLSDIFYGRLAHAGITWAVAEEQTVVFGSFEIVVPRYNIHAGTTF